MDALPNISEIVESTDELDFESKIALKAKKHSVLKLGHKYSIEDDINRLFEAIEVRTSTRGVGPSYEGGKGNLGKRAMKRPIRVGSPQTSGIGISEPVSLKQALRGLCISQASEMAAMKRLSRPTNSTRVSEAGTIKSLYRAVVVEANGSGLPLNEGDGNLVEISLVPEGITSSTSKEMLKSSQTAKAEGPDKSACSLQDHVTHLAAGLGGETLTAETGGLESTNSSCPGHVSEDLKGVDMIASASMKTPIDPPIPERQKSHLYSASLHSSSSPGSAASNSAYSSPRFIKPIFRNKNFMKKKVKKDSASASSSYNSFHETADKNLDPGTSNSDIRSCECTPETTMEENVKASPASSNVNCGIESTSSIVDRGSSNLGSSSNCSNRLRSMLMTVDEKSRSREKGEFSQSSKSSIGEYSSSTTSEESILSVSSRSGSRPHKSGDLRWEAIRHIQKHYGGISLKHFKLLKKLGCGDIGTIYLAELTGTDGLFALKVMDNEFLASRKKIARAQTEKEIMQMLDHPFLPTLYAQFVSDKLSCLVMEYCPGGDLHVLRQRQPGKCFSEQAARFYIAEVLLALEYLHMLGVVYRDLKPENILVREDGHIMLSDFDLSLRCAVNPVLLQSSSPFREPPTKKISSPCSESSCIDPFCLHPAWQVSCFTPRLLSVAAKSRKVKCDLASQISPLPQLVVEPTSARSNSFVGTHEYLAPEIIKAEGHGNAVDWWTFGIFMFELLYGKTPFKGSGNEGTLSNVVSQSLKFPSSPTVSFHARDLIRGLLVKDPESRLGSAKGAAEIKQHPFFDGLNWALIRCAVPPELPKIFEGGGGASAALTQNKDSTKSKETKGAEDDTEFEMF